MSVMITPELTYREDKILRRTVETARLVSLLRSTLERRVYIDEVIDNALTNIELELHLLKNDASTPQEIG